MATPIPTNEAAFSSVDLVTATGGALSVETPFSVRGVGTDTRQLHAGSAFVALVGERFDGHDHLAAAVAAGATLLVVERDVGVQPVATLRVASTLDALGRLGAFHIERWREAGAKRVIALTGSAGKTTTKAAIAALAESLAPKAVLVTQGNLNNRVGVPLTALCLQARHRIAVFELGTNAPGEIAELARIVRPELAVITLVAAAHTEGLGGIEGVAREKSALFALLSAHDGVAIGNGDDARVLAAVRAARAARRLTYGTTGDADYRVHEQTLASPSTSRVALRTPRGEVHVVTPLLGVVGALATAAAVATIDALDERRLSASEIEAALSLAAAELHDRMSPRELGSGLWLIDDSYNANPASCRASLSTAQQIARLLHRRLVVVLGEMRELGPSSADEHRQLGEVAAASGALLFAVGGDARHLAQAAERAGGSATFVEDAATAGELVRAAVQSSDVVLVKGSRGVRTEKVVAALVAEHDAPSATDRHIDDRCARGGAS